LNAVLRGGPVGDDEAGQIQANVAAALATLHSIDLVHCDVAPNNVFRVAGTWKLGDLDGCLWRGDPVHRFPPRHYRHPNAVTGAPADPAFDLYGLAHLLDRPPPSR
jgi:hypothetical protein